MLLQIHKYYDVPSVSFRDTYQQLVDQTCDCFNATDFMNADRVHPNSLGNQFLAQTVTYYLQFAQNISNGAEVSDFIIPETPLFVGNEVAHTVCLHSDRFHALLPSPDQGWSWSEDENKPGFVSDTPGSVLRLPFHYAAHQRQDVSVGLAYLRSYHDVGILEITCAGVCYCTPAKLNCFHEEKTSQQYFHYFDMTFNVNDGEKPCYMNLLITEETNTSGHMMKVSGITWEEGHRGTFKAALDTGMWGSIREADTQVTVMSDMI